MITALDIRVVARAALADADVLVPRWLPDGRLEGREWSALNPMRGDTRRGSFKVNLATGQWSDFATGDCGGDLVALFAYLFTGGDQGQAARDLGEILSIKPPEKIVSMQAEKKARTDWTPITPVPDDAPRAPVAHSHRGRYQTSWAYRYASGALLGYVCRFVTSDGGKDLIPLVWARNGRTGATEWRWQQWSIPRPMFGLHWLAERPTLPVLIVEGEKCAQAAHSLLGDLFAVVSWPGGSKAVAKVDWSPLKGRQVVIWPDCDAQQDKAQLVILPAHQQPGIVAAEQIATLLQEHEAAVSIVEIPDPGAVPSGWDVADAIVEGWDLERMTAFIARTRPPRGGKPILRADVVDLQRAPSATSAARAGQEWRQALLIRRHLITSCLSNLVLILTHDTAWQGVFGFDSFSMRTMKLRALPGRPERLGEWNDVDTGHTIIWLTARYSMTPDVGIVDQAIELVAQENAFHPVRDYLAGLRWDRTSRIDTWLEDYLGVERTEYTARVARWFLIGMVARVMQPGVKFDSCLVLEGAQGRRKSSALKALAGEWFSDTELDLSNKDAMSAIRGKWLHEFAEMGSLARSETSRQKSFLARQVDEFRPVFARREIRCPRQVVFAGSTNEWQWQQDPTGGRRFWPVEVTGQIDVEALARARDDLFAEAYEAYQAGERFWPTPDEQREWFDPQQLQREREDAFADLIQDWLDNLSRPEFVLVDVLSEALKLDAARMTRDVMTRAGTILKKLGCKRRERRNGVVRFVYELPDWTKYQRSAQTKSNADDRDGGMPI
ncbi:MAG: VapE domain-containing protein [Lautropia sp.]